MSNIINTHSLSVIRHNIQTYGRALTFSRPAVNEYGETAGELSEYGTLKCLYYYSSSKTLDRQRRTDDSGNVPDSISEMLLCCYTPLLQSGDITYISGIAYRITAVSDILNEQQVLELSIEKAVQDNG